MNGGGFMPGSQNESPSGKKSYGKDTLRPVTIKQLLDAYHPNPDAEHFMIDDAEATQVTFVGQVRNISKQTTNVTYKLDDGTGIIEVKVWVDMDAQNEDGEAKHNVAEQGYARVYGRLKAFGNKRHVGANVIRPIQDYNEIQYHLLEATVVHLHFVRGSPEGLQQGNGGMNGAGNGMGGQQDSGDRSMPSHMSPSARKVFACVKNTPQTNEGLHMQDIATRINMDVNEVLKAGDELQGLGLIYTTVDDHTWAVLEV